MNLKSIGKNIAKARKSKKLTQEKLAEMASLSPNYIGMIERSEKIPSLESFINILNALDTSADIILADVLKEGYTVKTSRLSEKLSEVSSEKRNEIYNVIDAILKSAES